MDLFITVLLCLSALVGGTTPAVSQSSTQSEPGCDDWGESGSGLVRVLEGEAGWLSCPLFSHPTVYNYSSALSNGLNLFWYRVPIGQDLEQPIGYSQRLSKEREKLWLQPAVAEDTGQYICMLRNKTSCTKIAMQLEVIQRGAGAKNSCELAVAMTPSQVAVPFEEGKRLDCPDLQDVRMANSTHSVVWYNKPPYPYFWHRDMELKGDSLVIHKMVVFFEGVYCCVVSYERKGRTVNFTRLINITGVSPTLLPKIPTILKPANNDVITISPAVTEVQLECVAIFPYLEGPWEMWWSVDGKKIDHLVDPHFTKKSRLLSVDSGDRTEESTLVIKDFKAEDLRREYNCSVRNQRGFVTHQVRLEEEASLPAVELGCGLGVTLFLMLVMFVVYHVFWLELLLLYRSWFGTDERHTDDKEYDIYISYARDSEEEQFVLSTLRTVLENDLGYTVCIFDRDSLPGGTITDETLSFVGRSRRLLVVLSPGYGAKGTQALLELKAGLHDMARGGHLRVILVQYKPLRRQNWVKELRRARVALALIRWQGDKSSELTSRFWKRLRVELPVRRVRGGSGESVKVPLNRILSQNDSINSTMALIPQHTQPNSVKE